MKSEDMSWFAAVSFCFHFFPTSLLSDRPLEDHIGPLDFIALSGKSGTERSLHEVGVNGSWEHP